MTTLGPVTPWEEESEDALSEQAAEFHARRRFGDWSETDQAGLDAWLGKSILHEVAYLRVQGLAAQGDELAALNALELKSSTLNSRNDFSHRRFILPLLAAASVALAATFGGRFVAYLMQPPDSVDSTDVGGRTLLTYGDHTQIELNTNTAVRVRMTSAERTVWLDKGEAWFHVAHDAKHPFTVIVGQHRISDLGTEFLIRRDSGNVDVTLLSGRAALSTQGAQTATLKPGDEAVASPASLTVTRKTLQELDDELAWRRGMLVFRNAPLSEVVRQFNRYNATRLAIADPSIANATVSANLKADDYESFLHLAEDVLKLHVDRKEDVILISRGQQKETMRAVRHKRRP